jgi:hypothetical protein
MGTGMPNWGTILTDEAVSALVDYLWTFPFPGHPDVGVSVSAYFSSR